MKSFNHMLYTIFLATFNVYYMNNLFSAPCNGKVCSNGGTLDSKTCECACAPPYLPPTCDEGTEFLANFILI